MMTVDITIPVYNEEHVLRASIAHLVGFLRGVSQFTSHVVIADNASSDRTLEVAQELVREYPTVVDVLHLPEKGRGRALKASWAKSRADVVSYMDVDLSTNLKFFPLLVQGLSIGYDLAVGSRLLQASETRRSFKREIISRSYNELVKLLFWSRFSDAQCGFKAVARDVVHRLIPYTKDDSWFFDTELMLLAEKAGFKIFELPVEWIEDSDSRVDLPRTIMEDLRGLLRMRLAGFPTI